MDNTQATTENAATERAQSTQALMSSFMERHQKENADRRTRMLSNRKRIHKALKRVGATKVIISYCGSGDSGQIEQVSIYQGETEIKPEKNVSVLSATSRFDHDANAWLDKVRNQRKNLAEAVEDLVYDWIEMEHPGWENNDGASGECTIDVATDDFLLSHTSYYTESDTTEHSL